MIFFRDPENERSLINGFRERREWRPGFDSDPEDAGGFRGWEEAEATECDFDRLGSNAGKGVLDFFDRLDRLLSDKLQGHVQRFGTDPAGVWSEATHTFHEALNALADGIVDVEGDESSHNGPLVVSRSPNHSDQRPTTDLHQLSSHHVERLLAGEPADAFAIAGECSLHDFGSCDAGQRVENQPYGFCVGSAGRSGDACNA